MSDRVRYGVHEALESRANELITASLEGVTSREEKADVMTKWKSKHRKEHEILSRTGTPIDPSVRRGLFTRAWNSKHTYLNSCDGPTGPAKMPTTWDPEEGASWGMLSPQMSSVVGVERYDD